MADIENINISTSEFSFDNIPFIIKFSSSDYTFFSSIIYIVIAFVIVFVFIVLLFLIYKYFVRGKKVTFQDKLENCYGDGCKH